jgi:GR25 family glycosyltransferase involved in LPS biosynthesis
MEETITKYFDAIDIIYWINLDRSEIRRKNMEEILKYFPVKNERIPAVDGNKISLEELLNFFIKKKNIENQLNKSEYGCLLSHLNTINKFSKTNYKYALIFEDDITLEYVKYWNKKISNIIDGAPKDWEIIMMNYSSDIPIKYLYELNINKKFACAQAYIINNTAAKKFINKYYINFKYDLTGFDTYNADFFIFNRIITYCYKYPYFTYSIENESTIHQEHLDYHKILKKTAFQPWEDLENAKNEERSKNEEHIKNKEHIKNEERIKNEANKTYYLNILLIGIIIILITLILRLNYQI